jgi:hypothetical protein
MRFVLVLLALFSASGLGAREREVPLELWGGLYEGMPREEVEARHPGRTLILGGDCRAQLRPVFRRRRLQAVRITRYLGHNDCGREVFGALMRKYGPPRGQGGVGYLDLNGFGNSHDFIWYDAGRAIKLRLLQGGRFGELSYAPAFDGV